MLPQGKDGAGLAAVHIHGQKAIVLQNGIIVLHALLLHRDHQKPAVRSHGVLRHHPAGQREQLPPVFAVQVRALDAHPAAIAVAEQKQLLFAGRHGHRAVEGGDPRRAAFAVVLAVGLGAEIHLGGGGIVHIKKAAGAVLIRKSRVKALRRAAAVAGQVRGGHHLKGEVERLPLRLRRRLCLRRALRPGGRRRGAAGQKQRKRAGRRGPPSLFHFHHSLFDASFLFILRSGRRDLFHFAASSL